MVKEISGGTNKKWTDTSVELGKRYWYKVQSFDENRTGDPYTNKVAIRTLGKLEVDIVISNERENSKVHLKWGNTIDYTKGYLIKKSTSPSGQWSTITDLVIPSGGKNEWYDETVSYGNQYYYRVQPYNEDRAGGPHSNVVEAYVFDERTITLTASKRVGNTLYEIYDFLLSWKELKAACERMGGHLVTITSDSPS